MILLAILVLHAQSTTKIIKARNISHQITNHKSDLQLKTHDTVFKRIERGKKFKKLEPQKRGGRFLAAKKGSKATFSPVPGFIKRLE